MASAAAHDTECPIHNLLSPELREQADAAPYLMNYLHRAPIAERGAGCEGVVPVLIG